MNNKDKFLKEGVSVEEICKAYKKWLNGKYGGISASLYFEEFIREEAKPTLTEDERVILKHISIDFKYICRNGGFLYFNCVKGQKCYLGSPFGYNTFQFIKERRRIQH